MNSELRMVGLFCARADHAPIVVLLP